MPLVLLCALLTLRICAGAPMAWVQVQVQTASTELLTFTIHCGFLGSGLISLVTVSWSGLNITRETPLAVLHPQLGVHQLAPALQARWLNESSISLTLEGAEGQSPQANITFCCKFVTFPEGSHVACGHPLASSDQGLPAPSPAPLLQASFLGASGGLLLVFVFVLHLLRSQWRHWSIPQLQCHPLARIQDQMASSPIPAPSSFVYVENGLYVEAGARPPHTAPSLTTSPNCVRAMDMKGYLGA
ncbi:transmembrane protein PVRIG [Octodon degus]|uniref:Transmembrane protein PVRIG n=1 Tax=Octodon degus TaxID=10160 RepID=A0A6P6ECK4_OCTDE|nr:transmembrane protein PVRIG [Octodon degus]